MSSLLLKLKKSPHIAGRSASGFTLMEVLITIAMISIFMPSVYAIYTIITRSLTTESVVADVQQDVRFSLDFMVQDIRMAGLDPTSSGKFGIEVAEDTKIRFTLDNNYNGSVDGSPTQEQITYLWDGTTGSDLQQILYEDLPPQSSSTQALIENVTALSFTYLDKDGNTIAAPVAPANLPDIKEIDILLTAQAPAGQVGTISRTYNARVRGRNL